MRILFWSNAPFLKTGYAKQVKGLIEHLQEHEFAVVCNAGLSLASLDWRGVKLFGCGEDPMARDVVGAYARTWSADVVISLYDVWTYPDNVRQNLPCPWIAWTPVDGIPVTGQMRNVIRYAEWVAGFSQFGVKQLEKAGIENVTYLPLGIDCDVFKPGNKLAAREALNLPEDRYLVTMVGMNKGFPSRKGFPIALRAFKRFQQVYPEGMLYLHTTRQPIGSRGNGTNFDRLLTELDIGDVVFPPLVELLTGIPDEQMALIYQASDVLLNPSLGEGFCLPLVEAQACGCPVISVANSAQTENTADGIATLSSTPVWTPMGYWWYAPEVGNVVRALNRIYLADASGLGARWARERYDWDVVIERYWEPFLKRVEAELW